MDFDKTLAIIIYDLAQNNPQYYSPRFIYNPTEVQLIAKDYSMVIFEGFERILELSHHKNIIIVTGRDEEEAEEVVDFLNKVNFNSIVITTARQDKGVAVEKFLNSDPRLFTKVIFADDDVKYLTSVDSLRTRIVIPIDLYYIIN